MIISLKHLNTYLPSIQLDSSIEQVLNNIGFEVESISKFSDVQGIKFAHVKKFYKNPNSDNLFVAELELNDRKLVIQTTDGLIKTGDLVVCFPPGSTNGKTIFEEKKLKGIVSQGMMASLSELGYNTEFLGKEIENLLRLPKNFASLADDPMEKLAINDYIIDISITSNRNDANSYYILAKELSAYFGVDLVYENEEVKEKFISKITVTQGISEELCLFEAKRRIQVETHISEKLLLSKHGYIVNEDWAVNLTNLCLLITGAPAHVYDKTKIGNKITTSLYTGSLKILGNKKINVDNALVVNDENRPISIASVIGLEDTKANLESKNIVFEIGNFNTKLVRSSSAQVKIPTESSIQASKTITKQCLKNGINFLRNYLHKHKIDVSNTLGTQNINTAKIINFDNEKLRRYSGVNDTYTIFKDAINKLKKLDFIFYENQVQIPDYRYDIELFEDVIEEIFRFYSYDNFKSQQPFSKSFKIESEKNLNLSASFLGYTEIRTYSLISSEKNFLNPFNFKNTISLDTYVSKEREEIRNSIIPSFLEVINNNKKREINNINIFEKGMINNNIYVYGFASTTKTFLEFKKDIIDFYKNDKLIFKQFNDNKYIHPNYSAKIYENDCFIGWIGKVHPSYDLSNSLVGEIFVPNKTQVIQFSEIDYSPLKYIDLTFELELKENMGEIIFKIKEKYDVYEVINKDTFIKNGKKYITLRVTADSKTIKNINEEYNS